MSKLTTVLRVAISLSLSYAFFGLTFCLALVPDLVRGPSGYEHTTPSLVVSFLVQLMPVRWFPFIATPVVFYAILTGVRVPSRNAVTLVAVISCLFLGSAAVISRDLLFLHSTYAVEPVARATTTHAFQSLLVVLFAWSALHQRASPIEPHAPTIAGAMPSKSTR